jgi:hypothetical protein
MEVSRKKNSQSADNGHMSPPAGPIRLVGALGLLIKTDYPIAGMKANPYARSSMNTALRIVALVALVSIVGCTRFPYGMSLDKHEFLSTPELPLTITLVDTVADQEVWRVDVPVNKKLVVDLEHAEDWRPGLTPASPAYKVSWQIMEPGAFSSILARSQELSGNPVLLKMVVRDSPELPGETPLPPMEPAPSSGAAMGAQPSSTVDQAHQPIESDDPQTSESGDDLDLDAPEPVDVEPEVVE